MRRSWAKPILAATAATAVITVAGFAGPAAAGSATPRPASTLAALEDMAAHGRARSETIVFSANSAHVHVFRGTTPAGEAASPPPLSAQIVHFGGEQVRIVRGGPATPLLSASAGAAEAASHPEAEAAKRIQRVSFGGATVTVLRGLAVAVPAVARRTMEDTDIADLFGPANGDELDRIAFAVEGVESSHGADLRMWRPEADGPQGPMQVSAAAALDVGGGDRFDTAENRVLGRAYLERMFRRYGNWPDAVKAYNWGPGNLDQWIAGGRAPERLPVEVVHYVSRVLRDALIRTAAAGL